MSRQWGGIAAVALLSARAVAEPAPLPLPPAPVRLVVPDVGAFDAALAGRWRLVLEGEAGPSEPVLAAWRQTQVGAKLEDQWSRLAKDLPWSWAQIRALRPARMGLALLEVGSLEAVLAIDTPLAALPLSLPSGSPADHAGVIYRLVARGAADGASDERRMGLAWARVSGVLLLATSARAIERAIDASLAGDGFEPPLPGIASLELDLEALRKDLYFRREFLFGRGPETGRVRAALRLEDGRLVEVREGHGAESPAAFRIASAGLGAGWEPGTDGLFAALRAALLEPVPGLSDRPRPPQRPLPAAAPDAADRYLADLRQPLPGAGPQDEEAELPEWRSLVANHAPSGWGWTAAADGRPRVVFEWPRERDQDLVALAVRTLERRAGRATSVASSDGLELQVGPGLAALAVRRTGRFLWIGPDTPALEGVSEPVPAPGVVRWARLELEAAGAEGARWQRLEGPASPEQVRPFSDRLLGLLGWLGDARAIAVERRSTGGGSYVERVVFE